MTQTEGTAVLSECGEYRYELRRTWGADDEPLICWVMLNPSTADADQDDPTIRRCIGFSTRWGFGRLVVVNLFARRATDPKELLYDGDPVGPANDGSILAAALESDRVIAAWGARGSFLNRAAKVTDRLCGPGRRRLDCLGKTKSGAPKHPLYIRGEQQPELYRGPEREAPKGTICTTPIVHGAEIAFGEAFTPDWSWPVPELDGAA